MIRFDAPVGTAEERAAEELWPGAWFDATGFNVPYPPAMRRADFHTGADLNLNIPHWNADAHALVYAVCFGFVAFAGSLPVWGKVIVVKHQLENDEAIWSRYAHLETIKVGLSQMVQRGDPLGMIGNAEGTQAYHLHFDMARVNLGQHPGDWPGSERMRLVRDYVNPLEFIKTRHGSEARDHPATPAPADTRLVTAAPSLRVRAQPSTAAAVIGYLTTGSKVIILSQCSGWGQIDTPYAGWISLAYTTKI
jgi:murein DD-endopeptidase MepM/ murein hydrolase activator NlpD